MKIYINVRINITNHGRLFTVWPRPHRFLPGIEFHTGIAEGLSEAIEMLRDSFPETFQIDDEYSILSSALDCKTCRPFEIVYSDIIRQFTLS